ncbi:hypothetical protein B0H17DRAFT_1205692 [Mycena rosella]|uniref:Uncharacterized protein n=1 Tax=Mycena rosella TaxID=1033263 RepID=A0AAD7D6H4_MYCRO|nr:hypothetical protein B0H17DRAFT_1205692 [Mycena rosella]
MENGRYFPKTVAKPKVAAKPKAVAKPKAATKPKTVAKPKVVAKPKAVAKPKVAAKPKAVAKPKVAAKPKTVAKPKVAAKPKTVAKPKVAAKPKTVVKPKVAAKPKTVSAKPKTAAAKPTTAKPAVACALPTKKPAVRRFLEYIGLSTRATPAASCPPIASGSTPAAADPKAAKAKAKADKAAKAQAKADKAKADAAAAEAAKRKVGPVSNAPSKAVQCTGSTGALVEIPLASIETAVKLAPAGPLIAGKNAVKFPHVFNNREAVKVASACSGKVLEEQAVGPDMSTFQNIPSVLSNFNQFRVVITTPDATTGATTFCGVMTHGTAGTGVFEKDLCAEV